MIEFATQPYSTSRFVPVQDTHHPLRLNSWQCHKPERSEWFVVGDTGIEPVTYSTSKSRSTN